MILKRKILWNWQSSDLITRFIFRLNQRRRGRWTRYPGWGAQAAVARCQARERESERTSPAIQNVTSRCHCFLSKYPNITHLTFNVRGGRFDDEYIFLLQWKKPIEMQFCQVKTYERQNMTEARWRAWVSSSRVFRLTLIWISTGFSSAAFTRNQNLPTTDFPGNNSIPPFTDGVKLLHYLSSAAQRSRRTKDETDTNLCAVRRGTWE